MDGRELNLYGKEESIHFKHGKHGLYPEDNQREWICWRRVQRKPRTSIYDKERRAAEEKSSEVSKRKTKAKFGTRIGNRGLSEGSLMGRNVAFHAAFPWRSVSSPDV
ncbi:hypothetical protein FNV43_RR19449 [Rhamnella rubrinervis]|uniref:Uncharacterized protein n=1 Tax=Rhamnella rubrinervis TaxID=2594499 RepID=A0A8K0E4I0_9ROSA|nr:hypothetical protein FNV43_RR19449 [Rhamnella rubrinervis]